MKISYTLVASFLASVCLFFFPICNPDLLVQISGGENKTKAHILMFFKKKKKPRFQNSLFKKRQVLHNNGGVHIPELNKSITNLENKIAQMFSNILRSFLTTGPVMSWRQTYCHAQDWQNVKLSVVLCHHTFRMLECTAMTAKGKLQPACSPKPPQERAFWSHAMCC